jgi:hypothetical protein
VLVIQVSLVAVESSWATEIAIYIVRERLVLVPATQTNVTLFCGAGELVWNGTRFAIRHTVVFVVVLSVVFQVASGGAIAANGSIGLGGRLKLPSAAYGTACATVLKSLAHQAPLAVLGGVVLQRVASVVHQVPARFARQARRIAFAARGLKLSGATNIAQRRLGDKSAPSITSWTVLHAWMGQSVGFIVDEITPILARAAGGDLGVVLILYLASSANWALGGFVDKLAPFAARFAIQQLVVLGDICSIIQNISAAGTLEAFHVSFVVVRLVASRLACLAQRGRVVKLFARRAKFAVLQAVMLKYGNAVVG